MTFFDCTADLVGQLNGNGQKGMLQIDAPLSKISGYATAKRDTQTNHATASVAITCVDTMRCGLKCDQ